MPNEDIAVELPVWTPDQIQAWAESQPLQRSYQDDIVSRVTKLDAASYDVIQYGALSIDPERYPLFIVKSKNWDNDIPTLVLTGGVHGYETSGPMGVLQWLEQEQARYSDKFNVVAAPCISPWGWETINRQNFEGFNPNREFKSGTECEEAKLLMDYFWNEDADLQHATMALHVDCHETTNSDAHLVPQEMLMRGKHFTMPSIPDGYYVVTSTAKRYPEMEKAIVDEVRKITHIAQADADGTLVGDTLVQEGVIVTSPNGYCQDFTDAVVYRLTTEHYPDSPRYREAGMTQAEIDKLGADIQCASIRAAVEFTLEHRAGQFWEPSEP